MVNKGYLVPGAGNTYDFYEVPQTATQTQKEMTADGLNFEESPRCDTQVGCGSQGVSPENIEINNMTNTPNNEEINNRMDEKPGVIQKPKVKEIVISRPIAEGKNRPKPIEKAVFEF